MSLSIVIPAYGFPHAARVIAALLPLEPLEILVVDSGPGVPVLPSHDCVRLIRLPQRVWPGEARNVGWKQARGEYVLFVDADVEFTEKTRQFVHKYLAGKPAGLALGVYSAEVPGDNALTRVLVAVQRYRFHDCFSGSDNSYGQSSHLIVRRDIAATTGYFNPQLRMHEDKEFCIRAANAGETLTVYPEFEANHLKVFSLMSLVVDHADKAFLAIRWQWEYPAIFSRVSRQMGFSYQATWIASALALVAFPLLMAAGSLSTSVAPVLAMIGLLPLFLCREVFSKLSWKDQCVGILQWPWMGMAMLGGTGFAILFNALTSGRKFLDKLATLATSAWRVVLRTGLPVNIVHFVTARCNLRCEHCFYKETLDARDPGEQSLQQLDKTTREAGRVLWYAIGGGEPFVRGDIVELVSTIARNTRPLMITLPTNGWYVDKTFLRTLEILQKLEGRQFTLQVSLDGPQAIHDKIRGEESWCRAKETFLQLQRLQNLYPNLSLGIITVVNEGNHQCYPDFIDQLVEEFRPNQIAINLYRNTGLGGPPVPIPVIEAYKQAVDRYEEHVLRGKLKQLGYLGARVMRAKEVLQKELIYRVAKFDEFVTPCMAGTLNYVIWENGNVSPCEVLGEQVGNIMDAGDSGDLRHIVRSQQAQALRTKINHEKCKCTYECAMTMNTFFSWPMTAKMMKKLAGFS